MNELLTIAPYLLVLLIIAVGYAYQALPTKDKREIDVVSQRVETIRKIVYDVVQKTEQTMYTMPGQTRKQSALTAINAILTELHIPISPLLIDVVLESIVSELPPTHVTPARMPTIQPLQQQTGAQPFTAQ